jgi:DNA-binding winged helix-turn-helix (wHTH) protein
VGSAVASAPVPAQVIFFEEFEADLRTRELRRRGVKVRLPDQSFQILAMLLEQRGELVTRDQIRHKLWPSDTFVDFDHGLNNAVNRLREALGDSADAPCFVQTLPRRGYRFIGTLNGALLVKAGTLSKAQTEDGKLGQDSGEPDRTQIPKRRKYRPLLWTLPVIAQTSRSALQQVLCFTAGRYHIQSHR